MRYFLKNYRPMMVVGIYMLAIVGVSMMLFGCATAKQRPTERSAMKDSVGYVYKTVVRDSVRMRDSVRWVIRTAIRDSVVVRVDARTGDVVGKDSWHWRDTDNSRDHFADVRKMVSGRDSVVFKAVRKDSVTVVPQAGNSGAEQKETHYWRTFGIGVTAGLLIAFVWKYRKKIFHLLSSIFIS